MSVIEQIEDILADDIKALGYTLVRVRLTGKMDQTLQVMIEHPDGKEITVDDCGKASHVISALLDVEDPLGDAYTLEVSSPGIERPLVKSWDFERFIGFDIKCKTRTLVGERKRHRGKILATDDMGFRLLENGGDGGGVTISFDDVYDAQLLLTDELLKGHTRH